MPANTVSGINPRQLAAFRAVIVSGSVTGAGRILHLSQPAVTRLIKDMELQLGLTLFLRQAGRITPTQDAQALYRDVERFFLGLERVWETARNLRTRRSGQLRIAAMPTLSSRVLPEVVERFRRHYADVDVIIKTDVSVRILDSLVHNEVDLGIARTSKDHRDLVSVGMPISEAVCIMPKDHPLAQRGEVSVRDLHGEPFISLDPNSLLRLQLESQLRMEGVSLGSTVQTLYSNTASNYVARGLGIAVVDPFSILSSDLERIRVRPFRPRMTIDFSAVYARDEQSPLSKAFAREVKKVISMEIGYIQNELVRFQ